MTVADLYDQFNNIKRMSNASIKSVSAEAVQKTQQLVARISSTLLDRLTKLGKAKLSSEQCFSNEDSQFLSSLPRDNDHYDIINSLLTCEMIVRELFADADWAEKIVISTYESVTHVLENFTLLQRVTQGKDRSLIAKAFGYSYDHLDELISELHSFPVTSSNRNKKSAFVDRHMSILEEAREALKIKVAEEEAPSVLLRQLQLENKELVAANTELKESLGKAEKELIQLEIKLVNLLNEEEFQHDQESEDLKEQLAKSRMEIDRMDEQFRIQINKYNEVFRSMEHQIRTLKQQQSGELIENLQTEIIRLREQRERDDIIIHDLKERERELLRQLNSRSSVRYQSPRASGTRQFKQYQVN